MDYNLLRSWLGLPPGAWPPDHYTILDFPPGTYEPAAVEPCVMLKMDRLRQHQLRHPELVSEGMNRLAQALITLTDPLSRKTYDSELGFVVPVVPPQALPQKPTIPSRAVPLINPERFRG